MPEFTVNPGDIMVKFTASEDRVVHGPGKVIKVGVKCSLFVQILLSQVLCESKSERIERY